MIYLIVILGIVLRIVSSNQSLWLDEATTALASKMSLVDLFTKFLPGDFHPPLYYLILKYWTTVFGSSEIALRSPSIIFGVLTIYVVYKISRNYYAPILVATSGLMIYYSQEARMYSLAAFLVSVAVYCFINKKWVWFSMSILAVGMTDYVALFILPVFWLFGIKKDFKKLVISHVPLLTFFVLWLPIFMSQLHVGSLVSGSTWWNVLGTTSLKNVALIPVKFVLGRISFDNKYLYGGIAAIVVVLYGYLTIKVRTSLKLIWCWLLVPITLGILIGYKVPTLSYFRFLFCLPALYVLTSEALFKFSKHKNSLFILVLAINILSSGYYLFNSKFQRENWRVVGMTIANDVIVLPSDSQKEALIYYGKSGQVVFYKNFNGEQKEVWLSRYVWDLFDPNNEAQRKLENLGYNKTLEANFNGIVLYKYAHRN